MTAWWQGIVRAVIVAPIAFLFFQQCPSVDSAKIICIYPISSRSHMNVFFPLAEALARAGHQVTTVAPFEAPSKLHSNHKLVFLTKGENLTNDGTLEADLFNPNRNVVKMLFSMPRVMAKMQERVMNTTVVQKFCRKEFGDYDLAITNAVLNNFILACARENNLPVIYLHPSKLDGIIAWVNGVPMPYSYIPIYSMKFSSRMNLWQRTVNTVLHVTNFFYMRFYVLPLWEEVARKTLPIKDFPPFTELDKNVSLVFVNTHFAIDGPLPRVPHVIDIGGIHCTPSKSLPKDLEDFVQGSGEHGFILFSLGSAIQGSRMPDSLRQTFIDVFAKLKQRVLWKFETQLENVPSNVRISKWLPQQDLLGHPKCKLFITHGGMLSIQEATYHGVPLIGIPIWLDQGSNVISAVEKGFAETISLTEITKDTLINIINKILNNPSYEEKVKQLSAIFKTRPLNGTATATYWVDYVLRFKGAPHLKNSAANELYAFQYFLLDVILILGIIVTIFFATFIFLYKICRRFTKRKTEINLKKIKKNN